MGFNGGASRLWDDLRGIHKKWITLRGAEDTCLIKRKGNKKRDGEQVSKRTKQAEWLILPCVWLRWFRALGVACISVLNLPFFDDPFFFEWSACKFQYSVLSIARGFFSQGVGVVYIGYGSSRLYIPSIYILPPPSLCGLLGLLHLDEVTYIH